jgi:DNA-binding beta-propeller fold protein YncE
MCASGLINLGRKSVVVFAILTLSFLISCGGGGNGSSSTGGGGGTIPPPTSSVIEVKVSASHIVYDAARQKIYASLRSDDASHPNSIAMLNPDSGIIESSITVGKDPNQLALSRDGKYLYVGIDSAGSVQRVNLNTRAVELTIPLPTVTSGTPVAWSIAVLPTDSRSFAVSSSVPDEYGYGSTLVYLFDGDVLRSQFGGSGAPLLEPIAFSDSGSFLYAADPHDSSGMLLKAALDASGFKPAPLEITGIFLSGDSMFVDRDTLLTLSGKVIDGPALQSKGSFNVLQAFAGTLDTIGGSGYLLTYGENNTTIIHQLSLTSFLETATITISNSAKFAVDLQKLGNSGFAYAGRVDSQHPDRIIITKQSSTTAPVTGAFTLATLPVKHLTYDPLRKKIYATLTSSAGDKANSVAVIDPLTATIEKYIPVGSMPAVMQVTSDNKYLYVGLDGAGAVARLNLSNESVEKVMSLGSESGSGLRTAVGIAPAPWDSRSAAVATIADFPGYFVERGDFFFDDGVLRGTSSQVPTHRFLAFGDDSNVYGISDDSSSPGFDRLYLGDSGFEERARTVDIVFATIPKSIQTIGPLIYLSEGTTLDTRTLLPAGRFTLGSSTAASRGLYVDDATNTVYELSDDTQSSGKCAVYAFDKTTMVPRGRIPFDIGEGMGFDFTPCGPSCFAAATKPGVFIGRGSETKLPTPTLNQLKANHLVYDPGRKKIYASISGAFPVYGNSVIEIDPITKSIERSTWVGSEPSSLEMTSDGNVLWVALGGSASIVKLDLQTHSLGIPISLGRNTVGYVPNPIFATSISVSPEDSDVVGISSAFGVRAIDHGTILTKQTWDYGSTVALGNSGELYSTDPYVGYLYRYKIDPSGIRTLNYAQMSVANPASIRYEGGNVYTTTGYVIDPSKFVRTGLFSGVSGATSLAFDGTGSRAYFLTYDQTSDYSAILGFDKKSFVQLGSQQLPNQSWKSRDLIAHEQGFAYLGADGHINFVEMTFRPAAELPLNSLPATQMVYDPLRQRIYAAIPSSGGTRGNTVTVINPATAAIESSIVVGSDPGALALSKDLQYLYVGLNGASSMLRINLATQQVDQQVTWGGSPRGTPGSATSITVSPSDPNTVAFATPAREVSIYKSGVKLSNVVDPYRGSDSVAFSDYGDRLYGYDQSNSKIIRMTVDATGVMFLDSTQTTPSARKPGVIFDSGRLYLTSGVVFDPVSQTELGRLLATDGVYALTTDSARVYFLVVDAGALTIQAYSKTSLSLVGSEKVPGATGVGSSLVRWGTGFAVSTDKGIVVIPNSDLTK